MPNNAERERIESPLAIAPQESDIRHLSSAGAVKQIEKLIEQNAQLEVQKKALEDQMKSILGSTSWRITAPIRLVSELYRTLMPLWSFRRHSITLAPLEALQSVSSPSGATLYRVDGISPSLVCKSDLKTLPPKWCLVRTVLNSPSCTHLSSFLHYQTGEGFTSNERFLIESEHGVSHTRLCKFPPGVKALKLDPFDAKSEFGFTAFELQELGGLQVLVALFKQHIWSQIRKPQVIVHRLRKAWALYKEGGFLALRIRLFADDLTNNYQEWVRRFDTIEEEDLKAIATYVESLPYKPLISLVLPTYNTPERWLRLVIESVRANVYQNWELCIADDASTRDEVRQVLNEYAEKDKRIKVVFREKNGHIAAASNSALELVTGDFVGLIDHDDEITPDALALVAGELNKDQSLDLIYSDEDMKTSTGLRYNPHFKSDWNPELLLSQNYICHFSVFRTALLRSVGGFRLGTEGAQDWDVIWRVADATKPEKIRHIPHVLYHWRSIEGSTAQSTDFKPYVLEAQKNVVENHLARCGIRNARIEILRDIAHLRVHFPVPQPQPSVSLIIPTRDRVDILKVCVDSILNKTDYSGYEIVIVDNGSSEPETFEYFESVKKTGKVRIVRDELPFNFSRINNQAVAQTSSELVAFLNNDLEVISRDWLSLMVADAVRPNVGGVGAQLWFPSNLLQHGGIVLGIGGVAGHNHKGRRKGDPGYFNRIILPQNLSAVTAACLVMRRAVFDEIGGFDESLQVAFNDVDLCLRIREKGHEIVYQSYAQLYHHESASRGYENTPEKFARFESEIAAMRDRWGDALRIDPYYNPNLTLLSEDFAFAFPPRVVKAWKAPFHGKGGRIP